MPTKPYKSKATDFSRLLSRYITESSYTIYKMSKMLGIDRTAIQHYIAGDALPRPENFESICSVLTITPEQKNELTELYTKERLGARTYFNRKAIKHMIEALPQYKVTGGTTMNFIHSENQSSAASEAVSGMINVNNVLINAVADEMNEDAPRIASTIPFDDSVFYDFILQILSSNTDKVSFDHYFRIYMSDKNEPDNINITNLGNILRMSLSTDFKYHPYGYYAYKDSVDDNMSVFPYCLITRSCAVMVSRDYQSGVVMRQPDIVGEIRKHIDRLSRISHKIIDSIEPLMIFDLFMDSTRNVNKSIEFQPCITNLMSWDIVKKRVIDIDKRPELLKTVKEAFFTAEQLEITKNQDIKMMFCEEGLRYFAKTGSLMNLPGQLISPLSVNERIFILKQLRSNLERYCMIDSSKMTIPPFMQLVSLTTNQCILSCMTKEATFVCKLTETSLCNAIDDFIESITTGGEMTVGDEETINIIDSCIHDLEIM